MLHLARFNCEPYVHFSKSEKAKVQEKYLSKSQIVVIHPEWHSIEEPPQQAKTSPAHLLHMFTFWTKKTDGLKEG